MSSADEAQAQREVQARVYMKGLQVFLTGVLEHFRSTTVFIPPPARVFTTRTTELGVVSHCAVRERPHARRLPSADTEALTCTLEECGMGLGCHLSALSAAEGAYFFIGGYISLSCC